MNQRHRTLRKTLGLSALAGILVGSLIFTIDISAKPRDTQGSGHNHAAAIPRCDGFSDAAVSEFYAEITRANEQMHKGMDVLPTGDVDRDFAKMMIPHHQGAIDMALVLLKHGRDERLRRLAQSIIVEQGQEIAYMRSLFEASPADTSSNNTITDQ